MLLRLLILLSATLTLASGRLHFIPHSHMDMGWVQSINEYFESSVCPIHDSVMEALKKSPASPRLQRKFVLNDLMFLRMWLQTDHNTTSKKTEAVQEFVKEGVLELVGTGMVMPDTACPHYEDMVTNFFAGIAFTETHFTTRSQVAFQLDSFGQTHALFYVGSLFGLHDAVFHRIHHPLRDRLKTDGLFEFQWLMPFGRRVNVHINENYGWDRSFGYLDEQHPLAINETRYQMFKRDRKMGYLESKMILLGDDFEYRHANNQFELFEKVVGKDQAFSYSTMAEYLDDFYAKKGPFSQVTGDFMPYVDPHQEGAKSGYQAWTGYFTSKPNLKHRIRRVHQMHRALMLWATSWMAKRKKPADLIIEMHSQLIELSAEVSILLHHDCITGTAKRDVDTDYYDRIRQMEERATRIFDRIANRESYQCDYNARLVGTLDCFWLKEEIKTGNNLELIVINPTATVRTERIRLTIPYNAIRNFVMVYVSAKDTLSSQVLCFDQHTDCIVEFDITLFAFDRCSAVYLYSQDENRVYDILQAKDKKNPDPPGMANSVTLSISQGDAYTRLDTIATTPVPVQRELGGIQIEVEKDSVIIRSGPGKRTVVKLELMQRKNFSSNAYITYFLGELGYKSHGEIVSAQFYTANALDQWGVILRSTVGTFWIHQPKNKEHYEIDLWLRWDKVINFNHEVALFIRRTDLSADSEFWVESNGLFDIQRRAVPREDYSIYPTTTKATLNDLEKGESMVVWGDRARGVSAIGNQMHVFIQRSASTGKGQTERLRMYENVFTKLKIQNSLGSTADDSAEVQLRNEEDIKPLVFFNKRMTNVGPPSERPANPSIEPKLALPESVRMSVNIGKPGELVIRLQNISRQTDAEVNGALFLVCYFPGHRYMEVDFHMVTDSTVTEKRSVQKVYTLPPLQFVTFLAIRNPDK
jgi:hypothetical protein